MHARSLHRQLPFCHAVLPFQRRDRVFHTFFFVASSLEFSPTAWPVSKTSSSVIFASLGRSLCQLHRYFYEQSGWCPEAWRCLCAPTTPPIFVYVQGNFCGVRSELWQPCNVRTCAATFRGKSTRKWLFHRVHDCTEFEVARSGRSNPYCEISHFRFSMVTISRRSPVNSLICRHCSIKLHFDLVPCRSSFVPTDDFYKVKENTSWYVDLKVSDAVSAKLILRNSLTTKSDTMHPYVEIYTDRKK